MERENDLVAALEALFDEMVSHQEERLFKLGRRLHPSLAREDLRSVDDLPRLAADPHFAYEDGQCVGLLAAQAATRALLRHRGER